MNLTPVLEYAFVGMLALGVFFSLVGSLGLLKLSDFMRRLHGPTKATTLGVGSVLVAAILHDLLRGDGPGLRELLITLFLFLTAPVSAKLLAMAAIASERLPLPRAGDPPQAPPGDG